MGSVRYVYPSYTGDSATAVNILSQALETGLTGQGLTPELTQKTFADREKALTDEYQLSKSDLESQMFRSVAGADIGLKQYMRDWLKSQYASGKDELRREKRTAGFEDLETAQNLALGFVGGELGISSSLANMLSESSLRRMQSPSFESELFGGLGGATGMFLAGQLNQSPTQTYTPENTRFPNSLAPGYTGSGYIGNFPITYFAPTNYARTFSSTQ